MFFDYFVAISEYINHILFGVGIQRTIRISQKDAVTYYNELKEERRENKKAIIENSRKRTDD